MRHGENRMRMNGSSARQLFPFADLPVVISAYPDKPVPLKLTEIGILQLMPTPANGFGWPATVIARKSNS
jgi:hypothetical protein